LDQRVLFSVAWQQIPESRAGAGDHGGADDGQHVESLARYENGLSYAPSACLAGANFSGQGVNSG
jgi:hypothetical protein